MPTRTFVIVMLGFMGMLTLQFVSKAKAADHLTCTVSTELAGTVSTSENCPNGQAAVGADVFSETIQCAQILVDCE